MPSYNIVYDINNNNSRSAAVANKLNYCTVPLQKHVAQLYKRKLMALLQHFPDDKSHEVQEICPKIHAARITKHNSTQHVFR